MSDTQTHGDRLDALEKDFELLKAVLAKKFTTPWIHPEDEHRAEMAAAAANQASSPATARLDADQPRLSGAETGADKVARRKDWASHEDAKRQATEGVAGAQEGIVTGQAVGVKPEPGDTSNGEKTKDELLDEARKLDIEGRSSMSKDELEKAIADKRAASA